MNARNEAVCAERALPARADGPLDEAVEPATVELIDAYLREHPGGGERLIPVLHRTQEHLGYLPFPVIRLIAGRLGLSPVQVFGVVSFYHFFTTVPRGRYQLKVCLGTACFVRNAGTVIEAIHDAIGIGVGEVTADRLFSLEQVRCLGACGLAPAMMINSDVHGHLNRARVRKLLQGLRAQAKKAGPVGADHE